MEERLNKQSVKVSIITITLNGEKFLDNVIQSVLNQTYKNIEYIVVDGGSKDGSLDVIKKYEKNISHWVSEPDHGISAAWNKAIRLASGELIGLINCDDWYEPEAVEKIVNAYVQNPNADVLCGNLQNWENGKKEMFLFSATDPSQIEYEMVFNHPACFVAKRAYEKFGLFREDYCYAMDYELLYRFYKRNAKFVYVDAWISNMRLGGLSDKYWFRAYFEMVRCHLELSDHKIISLIHDFYKIIRTGVRIALIKMGLNFFVVKYRAFQKKKRYIL